jgi:hypothetical protein
MMKSVLALAVAVVAGCGGGSSTPDASGPDAAPPFDRCEGTADTFVRQSMLGILGRRPLGQAEVDVYADLWDAAEAQSLDPRPVVARAIIRSPGFVDRWVEHVADGLAVQRIDVQSQYECWSEARRPGAPDPGLAAAVRDQPATGNGDGMTFGMLDLARSSIALDDLTPIVRGQIFAMISLPIPAANVPPIEAELARRDDFGATFDSAYLNRDLVCLGCHNSEGSVTDSDDPAFDRHHPVVGFPEKAVYGVSIGILPDRAHAAFRVEDFVQGSRRPWGWSSDCGTFSTTVPDDPADIDGKLASLTGKRTTAFDLDLALSRGFTALRGHEPPLDGSGAITDPDTALAWLVTLSLVEDVWREVVGSRLTIANYFPRNQASAELLQRLAIKFTTSEFSLEELLVEILSSEYFDRKPPEEACGASPYNYPNVYDPWVIADSDPARRLNGAGDAVTALGARTLLSASASALEWPDWPQADGETRFPCEGSCSTLNQYCQFADVCCATRDTVCAGGDAPLTVQRDIGVYLRNSEHGFRGLDFHARLSWEKTYGACTTPNGGAPDFIDDLLMTAGADAAATAEEVVVALKDRVIGEPAIVDDAERAALVALLGGGLDRPASALSEDKVRKLCGALLQSPQFLLQGMAGRGGTAPRLTPATAGYDAVCAALAGRDIGLTGQVVACTPGAPLTLVAGRLAPPAPTTVTAPPVAPPKRRPALDRRRTPAPVRSMR